MTVGTPIRDYRTYLNRCLSAANKAFIATQHDEHKWMSKAYKHALEGLDKFKVTSADEHGEHCNGSPGRLRLVCQDCGKHDETVEGGWCPYDYEVKGLEIDVIICEDCSYKRAMNISKP